jgi:hypothetical protein
MTTETERAREVDAAVKKSDAAKADDGLVDHFRFPFAFVSFTPGRAGEGFSARSDRYFTPAVT